MSVEHLPTEHRSSTSIITARDAISHHIRWKITLQLAITRHEQLSLRATNAIQQSAECSIGKWLFSTHTLHLRATPEYLALVDAHEHFHDEMRQIARLIESQDFAAAERALEPGSSFQCASQSIANAMMALDHVQTLAFAG
jgi:Chemoreceptor zinc-binding domain